MQSPIEYKASLSIYRLIAISFFVTNVIVLFRNPALGAEIKQFRAAGTHVCQSAADIGHKCDVFGTGYSDCNVASNSLKARDCCPQTRRIVAGKSRYGGATIGFSMKVCTSF